ncbi:MAG: dienelactone hydrolase family protein [Jaaginema sp. PMC 1079.18]|nr:dienelactone hydrolase family protein [Jaaginema sp. PMC 1080.18]MEC4852253.1 dienelactone hydrolase family protein [Jaaginema sp. PMC 1079.18]MEC4865809.1 dienelactone hydrolase family protein [Jaaginema sp. PMC 1078.18]
MIQRLFNWRNCAIALATLVLCIACATSSQEASFTDRTASEHQNDTPVASEMASSEPSVPVTATTVEYATVNGETVTGYLAKPENAEEPLPAIIAIHEWWGLNENIEAMARKIAGEGYTVLAVDLYNGQVAETPENARQLMQSVMDNPAPAQDNLQQAYDYLMNEQNAPKVGTIGWCFGGAWSLQTALLLPEAIDATVIYYGQLVTDAEQLATLEMPILGIFGGQDSLIPVETVREFEDTLAELDKNAEIIVYEDAGHAFANPSGDRYVPEAAEKAWAETQAFFAEYLK